MIKKWLDEGNWSRKSRSRGQPALLYLVPCTLGLTLLLSLCRDAWTGTAVYLKLWELPWMVMTNIAMENHHFNSYAIYFYGSFSIAMLNNRSVHISGQISLRPKPVLTLESFFFNMRNHPKMAQHFRLGTKLWIIIICPEILHGITPSYVQIYPDSLGNGLTVDLWILG